MLYIYRQLSVFFNNADRILCHINYIQNIPWFLRKSRKVYKGYHGPPKNYAAVDSL